MKKYVYLLIFWQGYEDFYIEGVYRYKKDAIAYRNKIDEKKTFSGYLIDKLELR